MAAEADRRGDIIYLFGMNDDHRIMQVPETGASRTEPEEMAVLPAQGDDAMGGLRRPLSEKAACANEIVARDESEDENRARR